MTSNFHLFSKAVEARFKKMSTAELFEVDATDLYETYLAAFPAGSNPLFRVRTEHDCSCCKNFIRNIGHVVSLFSDRVATVWDVEDLPYPYDVVAKALGDHVRQLPIKGVYRTKERRYGNETTRELRDGEVIEWKHFNCTIDNHHYTGMPEKDRGDINTTAGVMRRGLEELTIEALDTTLDLINSNGLYRGDEHKAALVGFLSLKVDYDHAPDKSSFIWRKLRNSAARFRNTVIGSLVIDLSAGVDLEDAVRMFEKKVAPENYKRPTALITQKMVDSAIKDIDALGLTTAIERRYAVLDDVSVNDVLFVDNSVRGQMKGGLAGLLSDSVKPQAIDVKGAEDIAVADFLDRVVPQSSSIDLLLKNDHLSKFMSVTAPVHADAEPLFAWDNGFAWSYDGDVADSIKERVKRAGGNVDAALRVSLAWSNYDDLDIHAILPSGREIAYFNPGGILDVDMNAGGPHTRTPVENLSWIRSKLIDGTYRIHVNQFQRRETENVGFTIELANGGDVKTFSYDKAMRPGENVLVFDLMMKSGLVESIQIAPGITSSSISQEKWGIKTETLVPVDTLITSPNHWAGEHGNGNKHWFFILKGCKNPGQARGIYNEFLRSSLTPHRKVLEVLGAKTKCPPSDNQLSGVGFSSTRHDQATVVVKGNSINKAFNIHF